MKSANQQSVSRHILFDVDGVLITPGGYRKALQDTIAYFLQQANLDSFQPEETVFEHFESMGITSEWDMVPLFLCCVFEHCCMCRNLTPKWTSLEEALSALRTMSFACFPLPNYHHLLDRIGNITGGRNGVPSEYVIQAILNNDFPFPHLRECSLLTQMLCNTRSLDASPTMAIFQQHILGSALFEERYRQPAILHKENYLRTYDHSPLTPASRILLQTLMREQGWHISIYTARPSMPPPGFPVDHNAAFSPEAEQAQALIDIENIHLCAYGKLVWLSEQVPLNGEQLLKPSPVHALAAIASHHTPNEDEALRWAAAIYMDHLEGRPLSSPPFALPGHLLLHVFEDSPGGLKGGRAAADLLEQLGVIVELHLWGITASEKKKAALQGQGGIIFTDINAALQDIFC